MHSLALLAACLSASGAAAAPCVGTVAGVPPLGGSGGATGGEAAASSNLGIPLGVALATGGRGLLISTASGLSLSNVLWSVSLSWEVTAIAGGDVSAGADWVASGVASASPFFGERLAVNPLTGDVAFGAQCSVQAIDTGGLLRTLVGGANSCGAGGDGGLALAAQVVRPSGLTFARDGTLYFVDDGTCTVRMVGGGGGAAARITLLAGVPGECITDDDGAALTTRLGALNGIALLGGDVYFTDYVGLLRRLSGGRVETVVGQETLVGPTALVADASGAPRLFIADFDSNQVFSYAVNTSGGGGGGGGSVELLAGSGRTACAGDGGPAAAADLVPYALAFDGSGALLIIDTYFGVIRAVNMTSRVTSSLAVAGLPTCEAIQTSTGSGAAAGATLNQPVAVAFGPNSSFVFADFSSAVWRVDAGGALSPLAGISGQDGFSGDGGLARAAKLSLPKGLAFTADGALLIADRNNHVIRRVDGATGRISTVAGSAGVEGYAGDGGPASAALLQRPRSLRVAAGSGDVYFVDGANYVVRVIRGEGGGIATVAGRGAPRGYGGDGGAALDAIFDFVADSVDRWQAGAYGGIGLDDRSKLLYIADTNNFVVRAVNLTSGRIAAFAGTGGVRGHAGDGGLALAALLDSPTAVDVQPGTGCVFIAEAGSYIIRSVCAGVIATAAGVASEPGVFRYADGAARGGGGSGARFGFLTDLAFSADGGALLIADAGNGAVRLLTDDGNSRPCPAGFACRCGRDLSPCTRPSGWCPADSAAAFAVTPGFAAVGAPSPFAPAQTVYAAQAPCPRGYFCPAGVALPCPPGSYGAAAQQPSLASCVPCAPGTYAAVAGGVGALAAAAAAGGDGSAGAASPCAPCPAGTLARASGAAACSLCQPGTYWPRAAGGARPGDACAPCAAGAFSGFGAAACDAAADDDGAVSAITAGGGAAAAVFSFQRVRSIATGELPNNRLQYLIIIISVPVGAALLLPYLVYLLAFWRCPRARLTLACGRLLRCGDQYALKLPQRSGQPPVVERSAAGGALTIFAVGVVAAFAISTLLQFLFSNVLLRSSVLPLPVGLLPAYGTLPRRQAAVAVPAAYASLLAAAGGSGVAVALRVWGPRCAAPLAAASDLNFSYSASSAEPATHETTHIYACAGCTVTPLSALAVTLDPSCQALVATVAAVGVGGGLTAASAAIVAAPGAPLAAATARFDVRLEVVQDSTPLAAISLADLAFPLTLGTSACGYAVAGVAGSHELTAPAGAAPSAPIVVTVQLPLAPDFVLYELSLSMTIISLLANLAAWLGLIGIGSVVLDMHEKFSSYLAGAPPWELEKKARLRTASVRRIAASALDEGGGADAGEPETGGAAAPPRLSLASPPAATAFSSERSARPPPLFAEPPGLGVAEAAPADAAASSAPPTASAPGDKSQLKQFDIYRSKKW